MFDGICSMVRATLADVQWHLFKKFLGKVERLPPTRAVFEEHVRRENVQSKIWLRSKVAMQIVSEIDETSGWVSTEGHCVPVTSKQPVSPDDILELLSCNCKRGSIGAKCACVRNACNCLHCENTDREEDLINFSDSDSDNDL